MAASLWAALAGRSLVTGYKGATSAPWSMTFCPNSAALGAMNPLIFERGVRPVKARRLMYYTDNRFRGRYGKWSGNPMLTALTILVV
ncbi:MAG: hypothetical protein FWH34_03400 [Desulfovibrionaceae bacterium]|nr:hypothetical protein [Desulfovibrionaceae bacterium]